MRKFELGAAPTKTVEIGGRIYTIELGDAGVLESARALERSLKTTPAGDVNYRELADELIAVIDAILGEGAYAEIRGDGRDNILKIMRLLAFLVQEMTDSGFSDAIADITTLVKED